MLYVTSHISVWCFPVNNKLVKGFSCLSGDILAFYYGMLKKKQYINQSQLRA